YAKRMYSIRRLDTPQNIPLRLVIALCPAIAAAIWLSVIVSRPGTVTPIPAIASYLLPGHALPKGALCDSGDTGFRHISYCMAFQEGVGPVRFTYDRRIEVIRSASLPVEGLTIGDLILAWGTPNGYRRDHGTIEIFWREKSALTSA